MHVQNETVDNNLNSKVVVVVVVVVVTHTFFWLKLPKKNFTTSRLNSIPHHVTFSLPLLTFIFLSLNSCCLCVHRAPILKKSYISIVFLLAFEFILPMCTPSSM